MAAKHNLGQQFDQLALFDDPNTGEAAKDVMTWLHHPKGRGVSEWYPGWSKDNATLE